MIYLDNAATTPMTPSVIQAMTEVMSDYFGNPSSIHAYGRKASQLLRSYRSAIAKVLETQDRNIIFTSGGTESNNTAIIGYSLAHQSSGKHLITSSIEHHSVMHAMTYLEKRFGFEVTYLNPINGQITADQVKSALRPDTILVSIMHANNETGVINPIAEIGDVLADHQAIFHVDAVQTMGKIPVKPEEWHIDMLSASAHKFHGPKGVGFLFAKPLIFDPLLHGGEQEDKRRASTENMVGIAGMARALTDATQRMSEHEHQVSALKSHLLEALSDTNYYINEGQETLPYVLNIGFPGINNGVLLTQLDLSGFAVSTGSACTAGTVDPSHVLAAYYGDDSPRLKESIRISFSDQNTIEEVDAFATTLKTILSK